MTELGTTIELDFQPDGNPGVGVLRVLCGDDVLAAERMDLLDREQREAFIERLRNDRPGIDGQSLTRDLLRLAAKPVKPATAHKETPKPAPPQWRPFPLDALPMALRDFIATNAASMRCDPSMIALPAIATLAGAIGTTRQIHLKGLWYEYPIVWAAVVARSGTGKSPALDLAVRTIRNAQEDRFEQHDAAMVEHETARNRYDAELGDWKRKLTKGTERGEMPKKPDVPACVRYLVSDSTVESLVPILSANPRGVLLCRDELGGWLQSFNQYKGGKGADLQNWLEMHRGGPVITDRKTTGTLRALRAAVSVCGTVQPGTLSRLLTPEYFEAGLSARMLLAAPPSKLKKWTSAVPDRHAVDAYDSIVAALLRLEHDTDGNSIALPMTADAHGEFVRFYNLFATEQADADDDATAASLAKIEGYVPRLALAFALVDDLHAVKVEVDSMRSAITIGRWFARESQRVYGMLREKPKERDGRELVDWIHKRGGSATPRELRQGLRRYRDNPDTALSDLEQLARTGRGRWDFGDSGKPGAPSKRFRLFEVPSANGDNDNETQAGAIENGGSVDVDAVVARPGANDDGSPVDPKYTETAAAEADSGRAWGEL